jgi:F-type H+-transporting ATPase subunit b
MNQPAMRMKMFCFGLASGRRVNHAISGDQSTACVHNALSRSTTSINALLAVALLALVWMLSTPSAAAQEQSASPSSQQTSEPKQAPPKRDNNQAPKHKGAAGELVEETREATGEDKEEYANLKHASAIRWVAAKTGMSVHQAHMLALFINFAVIVAVIFCAARKFVPGMLRERNASIQRALEEARAASQEANRRLADIENRLRQLDVEIGQMQASAEKEADAEEIRTQRAAEEDIRKVVLAAEQEIAAAAKQARRELSAHTAGLAIALATKQINVDSTTDEMLVRSFASKLAANNDGNSSNNNNDGGKDRR